MTDEQKRTQEERGKTFNFSCCGNWSSMRPDQTEGRDRTSMMSRMMKICGGAQSEKAPPEEPGTPDSII